MSMESKCPECGAETRRANVERHLRRVHGATEPRAGIEEKRQSHGRVRDDEASAARSRHRRRRAALFAAIAAVVVCGVITVVLVSPSISIGAGSGSPPPPDPTSECVQHRGLGMHWHAILTITVGGNTVPVPAGVGIVSATCFRPLHTHDADGVIHIEYCREVRFTLGQFFDVWGQPLDRTHLMDREGPVSATVDGSPASDPRAISLLDGSRIGLEVP